MNKGKLIILMGIPGSGKSTIGKEFGPVYSSDDIRGELFGDPGIQDHPGLARDYLEKKNIHLEEYPAGRQKKLIHQASQELVFEELHRRIRKALEHGETVVYDATNLTRKKRMSVLREFRDAAGSTACVYVKTPLKTCMDRNSRRNRKVPKKVIKRMASQMELPEPSEGFDEIITICN